MRNIEDYKFQIDGKKYQIYFKEHLFKTGMSGEVYFCTGSWITYLFTTFKELTHVVITEDLVNQTREEIIKESRKRLKLS